MVPKKTKNANYAFNRQAEPDMPMGHGEFANLPQKGMIRGFPFDADYRDGIINGYLTNVAKISGIDENEK